MFSYQASLGNAKMGPKPDGCKAKHLTHRPMIRVAHDDSHHARASNKPKHLHMHLNPTASYRKANYLAQAPQPPLHANLSSSAYLTLTTSLTTREPKLKRISHSHYVSQSSKGGRAGALYHYPTPIVSRKLCARFLSLASKL